MSWVKLILSLIGVGLQFLQAQQLLSAGEMRVINAALARCQRRQALGQKISDNAAELDDGWLHPSDYGVSDATGRVLQLGEIHRTNGTGQGDNQ